MQAALNFLGGSRKETKNRKEQFEENLNSQSGSQKVNIAH